MKLGVVEGEKKRKPVPGRALLPNGVVKEGVKQYEWQDVGMINYDSNDNLYTVKLMGGDKSSSTSLYMIPRIRLMFYAEDPVVFADRLKEAFEARKKTEAL